MKKRQKGILIVSVAVVIVLFAGVVFVMTQSDQGTGLQREDISASEISEIEVTSPNHSVVVTQGDTDAITLQYMSGYRESGAFSYTLDNGKLAVQIDRKSTLFDLSLNPNRWRDEPLQISIPASAAINTLTIGATQGNEITVGPIDVAVLSVTTRDSNIRIIGMDGTVDAKTLGGKITGTAALSGEIVEYGDGSYEYQGQLGPNEDSSRAITLTSDSGNIIME